MVLGRQLFTEPVSSVLNRSWVTSSLRRSSCPPTDRNASLWRFTLILSFFLHKTISSQDSSLRSSLPLRRIPQVFPLTWDLTIPEFRCLRLICFQVFGSKFCSRFSKAALPFSSAVSFFLAYQASPQAVAAYFIHRCCHHVLYLGLRSCSPMPATTWRQASRGIRSPSRFCFYVTVRGRFGLHRFNPRHRLRVAATIFPS
jgi:hypothetical protein